MKIQKFLHSCLLIEENGQRLLVDPGNWSSSAKEIGPVDVIVITHEHQDHFAVSKIKELLAMKAATVFTNNNIVKLLAAEGIAAVTLEGGQSITSGAFTIDGVIAPHGDLPIPKPLNTAYLINKILLVTGDSLTFEMPKTTRIITLPVSSPWHSTTDAVALAIKLKPEYIIPVHESVLNPEFAPRVIAMCGSVLEKAGIKFHALKPGETIEI